MQPGPKKEGLQATGRSRGGLTSEVDAIVYALGNPVRWLLTGGEVADITQVRSLLDSLKTDAVLADKGYDADALIVSIITSGAIVIVAPKRNRVVARGYDRHLCKDCNTI